MKKFCLSVFIFFFCTCLLTGCEVNVKSDVLDNLSDVRYNIFVGQNSSLSANLMCGMRENPYNYDGVNKKTTEFGVVTVSIKSVEKQEQYSFTIKVGNSSFSGTLEENPYDHTFMTDIEKIVSCDEAVYLSIDGVVDNMQLICESKDWKIQYSSAIDIAFETLQTDLENLYEKKKFKAECYLKIVHDQNNIANPYYWCFMVIGQNGVTKSIIIDVNTGEVITKSN